MTADSAIPVPQRQVDAAGDDHERRAQCEYPDHHGGEQNAGDVGVGEEVRAREGEEREDDNQAGERQELLQSVLDR